MVRILLVDDDPRIRKAVSYLIQDELPGVTIDTAVNGEEACGYVSRTPPDAVVMDYQMPVLNGLSACARMRREGYDHPVIVWSSAPRMMPPLDVETSGATQILDKMRMNDGELARILRQYVQSL